MKESMEPSEETPLLGKRDVHPLSLSYSGTSEFSFKQVSKRKKFIFISMGFVNFCGFCCFSLMAPFFPIEAGYKGVPESVTGIIFGVFELVIVVSSPLFGNYVSKIGCKFMFVSGIMVCGFCAILFGTLDKGPDGTVFILMCFLCRSVEALGVSAYVTALFAILAHEFPDSVITVMGTLEIFTGLGLMVGPPIGGALYEVGGYGLPFFVMGSLVIVCGTITAIGMPTIDGSSRLYTGSVLMLLKSPLVVITCINIVAASLALGFMDPTLASHLQQFTQKAWLVGIIFLVSPALYTFTAPIWGYIGDKKGTVRLMIGLGNLGSVVCWLLLGPVPFLSFIPNKLYINVTALVILGLCLGCALIPTFKALLIGANSLGMPCNLDTYGKASGFFNSSFALGAFLGPTIGGYLVEKFTFPWACLFVAGMLGAAGCIMLMYRCWVPVIQNMPMQPLDNREEIVATKDSNSNSSEHQFMF